MITKIKIENFKSLKSLEILPKSLNLFMGVNGMGKSTVIQSLLLLRQSMKSGFNQLRLNGELVEIGRGKDALYNFAENEEIKFDFNFIDKEQNEVSLSTSYDYLVNSDVLDSININIVGDVANQPLFTNEFLFLNAERMSPVTAYEMSYDSVVNNHSIGTHGELAAHFLSVYGDKIIVNKKLCLESANSNKLIDQVQAWMNIISPGVFIDTKEIAQIDKVIISYGFSTDSISTDNFRPTNVGFGISYILPVLVACLSGMYKLIIIENPEAHLHPKGQAMMGELLCRCAATGAQLFVETHSDHIVNGIRVAVKECLLSPKEVRINYFTKKTEENHSYTVNTPIKIGANGELSEYPDDFIDEWENQLLKLL